MNTLILVNQQHAYPVNAPQDLVLVYVDYPNILMEREAAQACARLIEQIDGWWHIVPVSSWRSFAEQQKIYRDSLRDNGREFTQPYVAWPGCSEHQTGLAIDLGLRQPDIDFIRPSFPNEGTCQEFLKLAPMVLLSVTQKGKKTSLASPTSRGTSAM